MDAALLRSRPGGIQHAHAGFGPAFAMDHGGRNSYRAARRSRGHVNATRSERQQRFWVVAAALQEITRRSNHPEPCAIRKSARERPGISGVSPVLFAGGAQLPQRNQFEPPPMRLPARILPIALLCLSAAAGFSQKAQPGKVSDSLLQSFFSDFNLPAAADAADLRLRHAAKDISGLFVRMETAELQERPEVVLDSALRLCALPAAAELHDLASNRILQHAANSWAFNAVLRRVKSAAAIHNGCTFNLKLALLAAATDGANIDPDTAALSGGLLTRWRIAGPFGRYNNVDFERRWLPETERSFRQRYASEQDRVPLTNEDSGTADMKANTPHTTIPERFWFRNGMIVLPQYFASSGIFYGASEVEVAAGTARIDVLSSGTYEVFVDGKSRLLHDARY